MSEVSTNAGAEAGPSDFVGIAARVAMDRMSVRLYLSPVEGLEGTLTIEHLRAALDREEVVRGIDVCALRSVVDDWNRSPRMLETPVVARGGLPAPEKAGALKVAVRHLSAVGDVRQLLASEHYWQIASLAAKFQRVDQGTVVARRAAGSPSLLGYDVFGAAIAPCTEGSGQPEMAAIHQEGNVFAAGNMYTASVTGIAYLDDGEVPKVHPIIFDSLAEVTVSPDKMQADLTLTPAGERGTVPSEASVRQQIAAAGVVFGMDDEEIRVFLARFAKGNHLTPQTTVVARGVPAVKGADGSVEYCFNAESAPTPLLNPDGSADYRNISIVTSVGTGTHLARLIPPTQGTPGRDLAGRVLPALNGSPAQLPAGANTVIPKGAPDMLLAAADGIVRLESGLITISEGYMIPGSVDFSTGNVNYEGSVGVNGDIKSGFDVYCGGDLQVNGTIEDSNIRVQGNVLCRYGFVGNGKGVINAAGDVNLVYIKNQTVVSGGSVNIAKESINSSITARRSIKIYGHNLSVAGGVIAANESIIVKTIGNISGVKTIVQIVPEPEYVEQMDKYKAMTAQHEDNIKKLTITLDTLPPQKRLDKEFVRKLKNTLIAIKQEILGLNEKMRVLGIVMNKFDNSFIRIDRCAYPGTVFTIGQRNMVLNETLSGGKTIRLVEQEMKIF